MTKKRKLLKDETIVLTDEYRAIIKHMLFPKLKDSESFTVPCYIGNSQNLNTLIDSGVSINLMPLFICKKLGLNDPKAT